MQLYQLFRPPLRWIISRFELICENYPISSGIKTWTKSFLECIFKKNPLRLNEINLSFVF